MLTITIPATDGWDEKTERFVALENDCVLILEHSLVSISKWEAKYHKAFLSNQDKTVDEIIDYIRCMTINKNIPSEVYDYLTPKNIEDINNYIADPMSATTITHRKQGGGRSEVVTSELIYYWMLSYNIPWECQKWHLNRLMKLIEVCNIKNNPGKKMSQREILAQNASLNAARKKALNTRG